MEGRGGGIFLIKKVSKTDSSLYILPEKDRACFFSFFFLVFFFFFFVFFLFFFKCYLQRKVRIRTDSTPHP